MLVNRRAWVYCACNRCGLGCLDIFSIHDQFSFLSSSLWETGRYRDLNTVLPYDIQIDTFNKMINQFYFMVVRHGPV